MYFEWIQAFVCITETGTFTHAAEQLHLSQPGLSRRIEALEGAVGESLFIRGRRGVRLTETGRRLLQEAKPLVDGFDHLERLTAEGGFRRNRYTVGTTVSIGSSLLTPLLDWIHGTHPETRVDVRSGFGRDVLRWVRDGEVDLGVARLSAESRRLTTVPLYEETLVPVARPNHPLAGRPAVTAAEIATHPTVHYVSPSNFVDLVDRFWADRGLRPKVSARADRVEAVRQLLLEGAGVGFLPSGYVVRDSEVGLLAVLPLSREELPRYPVGVVLRQGVRPTAFLSVLVKTLRGAVPPNLAITPPTDHPAAAGLDGPARA